MKYQLVGQNMPPKSCAIFARAPCNVYVGLTLCLKSCLIKSTINLTWPWWWCRGRPPPVFAHRCWEPGFETRSRQQFLLILSSHQISTSVSVTLTLGAGLSYLSTFPVQLAKLTTANFFPLLSSSVCKVYKVSVTCRTDKSNIQLVILYVGLTFHLSLTVP